VARGFASGQPFETLAVCEVEPMTETLTRAVGTLMGRSVYDDVVHAALVEAAVRRGTGSAPLAGKRAVVCGT
jgi:hypothetical protein